MPEPAAVLDREPRYYIDDFVDEILTRRGMVIGEANEPLRSLVTGIVDQLAMLSQHTGADLRSIDFERVRWMSEGGQLVIDVTYRGRPLRPGNVRR